MASVHTIPSIEERFEFKSGFKRNLLILGAIGIISLVVGIFLLRDSAGKPHHDNGHAVEHAAGAHAEAAGHDAHGAAAADHHAEASAGHHEKPWTTRIWANLWLVCVYFTGISVVGMFWMSYNYLAMAGWSAVFKRIPEALPAFLPIPGIVMLVAFFFGGHELFHWTHEGLYVKGGPEYDAIMDGKSGFLNTPFYLIRLVLYFVLWYFLWRILRNASLNEDQIGGTENYYRSLKFGVVFLVVFGVTSSTSAWDFVMSIDAHWFSTMFGWYTLASWHVTGLAVITLIVVTLRENGYLRAVNESHLHDLGKFIFAFSIFWAYVWFAQFLLYYYANIPEEVIYFKERFSGYGGIYKAPFWINPIVNFVFPFLILMPRDSKRTPAILKLACWIVIVGHYLDFYNNIMPGTVGAAAGFGPIEIGFVLIFASAFIWVVCSQLEKGNLVPKKHPMLEESLHHDIA